MQASHGSYKSACLVPEHGFTFLIGHLWRVLGCLAQREGPSEVSGLRGIGDNVSVEMEKAPLGSRPGGSGNRPRRCVLVLVLFANRLETCLQGDSLFFVFDLKNANGSSFRHHFVFVISGFKNPESIPMSFKVNGEQWMESSTELLGSMEVTWLSILSFEKGQADPFFCLVSLVHWGWEFWKPGCKCVNFDVFLLHWYNRALMHWCMLGIEAEDGKAIHWIFGLHVDRSHNLYTVFVSSDKVSLQRRWKEPEEEWKKNADSPSRSSLEWLLLIASLYGCSACVKHSLLLRLNGCTAASLHGFSSLHGYTHAFPTPCGCICLGFETL